MITPNEYLKISVVRGCSEEELPEGAVSPGFLHQLHLLAQIPYLAAGLLAGRQVPFLALCEVMDEYAILRFSVEGGVFGSPRVFGSKRSRPYQIELHIFVSPIWLLLIRFLPFFRGAGLLRTLQLSEVGLEMGDD